MSLKRHLPVRLPHAVGVALAGALLTAVGLMFACSTYPTFKGLATDCTVENSYQFYDPVTDRQKAALALDNFANWYASADYVPDAGALTGDAALASVAFAQVTPVDPIPDGAVCGATSAGVIRFSHNNDWGGLFGPWDFGTTPVDASDWDGISFWARAPGNTTKGLTLSLNDTNTESDGNGGSCQNYTIDGGTSAQQGSTQGGIDPSTGTPLSGSGTTRAPFPNECANLYTVAIELTTDWSFYAIPFSDFQQAAQPNRVPNSVFDAGTVPGTGLLKSALRHFVLRLPKAAVAELWLAKLRFYKNKVPGANGPTVGGGTAAGKL